MDEKDWTELRDWTALCKRLIHLEVELRELREAVAKLEHRNVTMTIRDTTAYSEPTEAVDALMGLFEKDEQPGHAR